MLFASLALALLGRRRRR
ncbi:MAG: hypothetical protein M5U28_52725 [Sandaracinaceae bacterium]|nr:hypothetical protein [Sandaracinaceae bacterium]